MEFDEIKAIAFMRANSGIDTTAYDDDQLLNIIDIIWDFYEENGLLDIDADEEMDDEEDILDDLVAYATRMLKKDKQAKVDSLHIKPLIEAEIAYEQTLEPS
ncbi:MAG: hypothetical protein HDS02_06735 [Bacteroides sp.]|nr:hypothetical protein [Bacteroides sp.]MBD5374857.1 hypothetical protein [Bacteroides sp.]